MGNTFKLHTKLRSTQIKRDKMEKLHFVLLISSLLVASTLAKPQGYGSGGGTNQNQRDPRPSSSGRLPSGCQIDYKNEYDIEQVEVFDKKCEVKYREVCEDRFERICKPYKEEICNEKYRDKCEQLVRDNCYDAFKDVPYDEECNDIYVRECPKIWQEQGSAKVWVPDTTRCQDLKKTECNWVKKTKKEKYQQCDKENYTECKKIPYQDCNWIEKQNCKNEKFTDCKNQPYDYCEDVHALVPQQVTRKKAFLVCQDGSRKQLSRSDISNFGLDIEVIEKDAEIIEPEGFDVRSSVGEATTEKEDKPEKLSSDAVIFGQ